MYQAGSIIFYGGSGVCRVDGIRQQEFSGELRDYYVLTPIHSAASTVYLPTDSAPLLARVRAVMTKEAVEQLILQLPETAIDWIENENLRKQRFQKILRGGDQKEIAGLVRTVYLHNKALQASGRKLRQSDERFFKEAQRIFMDEAAYVLGIEMNEVVGHIAKMLGEDESDLLKVHY